MNPFKKEKAEIQAFNKEKAKYDKAQQCLIDNGIPQDEAFIILQALCYILLDKEIEQYFPEEE